MTKYEGKEGAYYTSLKFALEDGMIDHTEFTHLSDIREQLGKPIFITSGYDDGGYRGSRSQSQHRLGKAVDFIVLGMKSEDVRN